MALQAILASPRFVFRLEEEPAGLKPGQTFRISDLDLASRLSFFLWDTVPDAELMMADQRAESLSTRFASQWFRLQDVDKLHPDALLYPSYDHQLAEAYRRE